MNSFFHINHFAVSVPIANDRSRDYDSNKCVSQPAIILDWNLRQNHLNFNENKKNINKKHELHSKKQVFSHTYHQSRRNASHQVTAL